MIFWNPSQEWVDTLPLRSWILHMVKLYPWSMEMWFTFSRESLELRSWDLLTRKLGTSCPSLEVLMSRSSIGGLLTWYQWSVYGEIPGVLFVHYLKSVTGTTPNEIVSLGLVSQSQRRDFHHRGRSHLLGRWLGYRCLLMHLVQQPCLSMPACYGPYTWQNPQRGLGLKYHWSNRQNEYNWGSDWGVYGFYLHTLHMWDSCGDIQAHLA